MQMVQRFIPELMSDFLKSGGFEEVDISSVAGEVNQCYVYQDIKIFPSSIIWIAEQTGISNTARQRFLEDLAVSSLEKTEEQALVFILQPHSIELMVYLNSDFVQIFDILLDRDDNQELGDKKYEIDLKHFEKEGHFLNLEEIVDYFNALNLSFTDARTIESCLYTSSSYLKPKFTYDAQSLRILFGLGSFYYRMILKLVKMYFKGNPTLLEKELEKYRQIYRSIYGSTQISRDLLYDHVYYLIFINWFLYFQYQGVKGFNRYNAVSGELQKILDSFQDKIKIYGLSDEFNWIFEIEAPWTALRNSMRLADYCDADLFAEIYQDIVTLNRRQTSGEVYTPPGLVDLMLNEKVQDQDSIMDPSCGSGSFLIGLARYYRAKRLNKRIFITIYGIDINPLAIITARANLLLFLNHNSTDRDEKSINNMLDQCYFKIYCDNALNPRLDALQELIKTKCNLIVGNPPWINISSIIDTEEKLMIKSLAKEINILYGREAKNTEICTIFFFKCRDHYLKNNGSIFFILPASVLNGHQHVYFRYFAGFSNIEVWQFENDIFRVHSVCIYAKNDPKLRGEVPRLDVDMDRLTLASKKFIGKHKANHLYFQQLEESKLTPIYIKGYVSKTRFPRVGRFNPVEKVEKLPILITPRKSVYYREVKGGLRIVPRRWLVVNERPPFKDVDIITPDMGQQAKPKWANPPYKSIEVNSQDIRPFLKSQGLIPFHFADIEYGFIPVVNLGRIGKDVDYFSTSKIGQHSKKAYDFIDRELKKRKKPSASMKNLADNYTFNGRLLPTTLYYQNRSPYMVVHNSIGSIVKATVVDESIILDNSLYYYITENVDEAFYLVGVLNSPIMTDHLKLIGSTGSRGSLRNIHKNPYNYPIPKFSNKVVHKEIAGLSLELQNYVKSFICEFIDSPSMKNEPSLIKFLTSIEDKTKVRTIQNRLFADNVFKKMLGRLNKMVIDLFRQSNSET